VNCTSCGAGLASDQAYCIACGQRVGALGMPFVQPPPQGAPAVAAGTAAGSSRFALPIAPQMATTLGALAIGFGFVIGNAISPGVKALNAAAPSIAAAPAPAAPTPPADTGGGRGTGGGGGSGSGGGSSSSATVASTGDTSSSSGGGGGGGNKKKTKKKDKGVVTVVGTVVHTNPGAGSFAVAAAGNLQAVHAADLPTPGDKVKLKAHKLFNGTLAQNGSRTAQGAESTAVFSGLVSYRDDTARTYTVSSRGSSVLVHVPVTGAGDIPPLASSVTVTVAIAASTPLVAPVPALPPLVPPPPPAIPPCDTGGPEYPATPPLTDVFPLTQTSVIVDIPHGDTADVEGIVQAACADPAQLVLSADDIRESFSDIELTLPNTFDLTHLVPGQAINATASIAADNSFTVTGLSSDQGATGADDATQGQGTQKSSAASG
jgi:hypothetical protein